MFVMKHKKVLEKNLTVPKGSLQTGGESTL